MSEPTEDQVRQFIERHVDLWNAGDKQSWLGIWKAIQLIMEDPVGAAERSGQVVMDYLSNSWDNIPAPEWKLSLEHLIVCGNEAAAVVHNDGHWHGEPYRLVSIEQFVFSTGGAVRWRTFWYPPPGTTASHLTSILERPRPQ